MAENGRNVTWQWIAVTVVGVLIIISGAIMADTRNNLDQARQERQAAIADLQKSKVDKDLYYRDISEIRDTLKSMNAKLDRMSR